MKKLLSLFIISICAIRTVGQTGSPFIANFPPESYRSSTYSSGPQNWCIAQGPCDVLFVSNENMVLVYNGQNWQPVQQTEGKSFLRVAKGRQGEIYTGGNNELGTITADPSGRYTFRSLKYLVPPQAEGFEKISNLVIDNENQAFFLDKTWLLVWNGETIEAFKSKNSFRKVMIAGGKAFIQSKDDGLWTYEKGRFFRLNNSLLLDSLNIKGIHAAKETGAWLIVTKEQGIFYYSETHFYHLPSALDSLVIWNTHSLNENEMALATAANGLCLLNTADFSVEQVGEEDGLFLNSLIFPNQDAEGGIWTAGQMGINRVDYPVSLRQVTPVGKSRNLVLKMLKIKNQIYLGTTEGLFSLNTREPQPRLLKIQAAKDMVRSIIAIGDRLLFGVGGNQGIYSMRGNELQKISGHSTTAMLRSSTDSNRIFIGTETSLYSLRHENQKWMDEGPVAVLNHPVYHLAELPDGEIWAGYFKMSRIRLPDANQASAVVTTFDSTQGFTRDHGEIQLFLYRSVLYFCTNKGIFVFDESKNKLIPSTAFGERFAGHGHAARHLVEDLHGNIWLYDGERTGFLQRDPQGKWQWNDLPLRRMLDQEVWSIYPGPDSLIWIGTTTTLYCYDPRIPKNYHIPFNCLIDRVTTGDSNIVFHGAYSQPDGLLTLQQPESFMLTFPFSENNISFSFTATSFEYPEKTVYSHWLEGLESGWSPWGKENEKTYNNLREGTYTFHVRAKNLYDTISTESAYTFTILPPWYRTWWAFLIYFAAALGGIILLVRWRVNRANRIQEAERAQERRQQQLRLQATVDAQEKERARIARDLHDDIQVTLSTAKLKLNLARNQMRKKGIEEDFTSEPAGLVQDAIESVRSISKDLMPATLARMGLATALKELCEKVNSGENLKVNFLLTGNEKRLEFSAELALYRVVQELIANSLKHSGATEIHLGLEFLQNLLCLDYRDNGAGFDPQKSTDENGGLGVKNIESRLSLAGAKLSFSSLPGRGCDYHIEMNY